MATIYKLAQDCKGCYSNAGDDKSIWYDGESRDLSIQLLFVKIDDAYNFQNGLSNFRFDHPNFGEKITFERDIVEVYLAVPPRRLLFDDYKTEDNSDSPIFLSLADIKSSHSESVISNDDNPERSLQSLENL
jgi:hypothetical protein